MTRYGDFEQVNGATVNGAIDRAEKAEQQRDKLLEALTALHKVVIDHNCAGLSWGEFFGDAMVAISKAKQALKEVEADK